MLSLQKKRSFWKRGGLLALAVLVTASVTIATVTPPSAANAACHYYRTETTFERPWDGGFFAEPTTHYKRYGCHIGINQATVKTTGDNSYYVCAQFRVRIFYGYNNNATQPWVTICGNPYAKPPESAVRIGSVPVGKEYRIESRAGTGSGSGEQLQFQAFD